MRALLLIALLALPLLAAAATNSMQTDPLSWSVDDTEFNGYLVYAEGGEARPGVVMVPNWMGVNDAAIEKAKGIAAMGYVVLLADVYGSAVRPANAKEAAAAAGAAYADRATLRKRVAAAVDLLKVQAGEVPLDVGSIGAIGFCFGGATVLELARSGYDLDAVVSFHGALNTNLPAAASSVKAQVLVLNGADDTYVSPEHISGFEQEMRAAGADWQFVNFAGAVHCFAEADANSGPGCLYHPRSATRAYRMMQAHFAEAFAAGE